MAKTQLTVTEQLLRGVRDHIREHGADELSVRTLATAAGRSTMCIYTAFGSRTKLLAGVQARVAEELVAALRGPVTCASIAERYAAWAREEPGLFDFVLGTGPATDPELRAQLLRQVLDIWGQCPGGDADHVWLAWALAHGHQTGMTILSDEEHSGALEAGLGRLCAATSTPGLSPGTSTAGG